MSICFVNYCQDKEGGTRWGQWRARQTEEALRFGADEVRDWCRDDLLGTVFYQLYQDDFQHERGAGLTIWRPYILFQSLLETKCDVLMYIDCDLRIERHLDTFTNYTEEQDVVAVGSRWLNGEFTKREVLLRMGVDNEEYYNLPQLYGGLIAFKKSELSLKFLFDWHTMATKEGMHSLDRDKLAPEHPNYNDHRFQSLLTILYHRYGFNQYPPDLLDVTNLRSMGG
jgi:hypothetical protein